VPRLDVLLVEYQDVEMTARRALVRRDLTRDRPSRHVRVGARRLLDVLKQQDGPRAALFDDFDFVGTEVAHRVPLCVQHAYVEPDDLRSGTKDRLCRLRGRGRRERDAGRCPKAAEKTHEWNFSRG
jgi:hypothetical protein